MNYLAPSILSADFCKLGEQVGLVEEAGVKYLHIDVMDGVFVPSISFGMPIITSLRKQSKMFFDVHMMVIKPERYVEEMIKCGADSVTIHVEACDCIEDTIKLIHSKGVKAGIALNPETPVEDVLPYISMVDMVLVMTVHPGFGGQKYIPECTDKIRAVRKYITDNALNVDVEIDGGVNVENTAMNIEAGANVLVAGSAVFNGDIPDNIKSFRAVM